MSGPISTELPETQAMSACGEVVAHGDLVAVGCAGMTPLVVLDLDCRILRTLEHRGSGRDDVQESSAPAFSADGSVRIAVYEWDHRLTVMGFDARGALLPHVEIQGDDVFGSDVAPKLTPFVRACDDGGYLAGYSYRSTRFLLAKFHGTERVWSCDELAISQTSDVVLTRVKDTLTGRALKDGSSLWSVTAPLSAVAGADKDGFMVIDWSERLRAKYDAELAAFDRNQLGEISDEELMRICDEEASGPSHVRWLDAATGAERSRTPVAGKVVAAHPCGDVVSRANGVDTFKDRTFPARERWPLLFGGGVCLDQACGVSIDGQSISRAERSLTKPDAILHHGRIYARHGAHLTRLGSELMAL